MDDNENLLDFQKMNFPFGSQFTSIPTNSSLHQFTTAKFSQNLTSSNGQVVGLVSGTDGNVQFLRSIDASASSYQQNQTQGNTTNLHQAQTLILPIQMPGDKPGDAQQTVQIQVLNPNQLHQQQKFQMTPMQIPIHGFQSPTVLTVSVPQDGDILSHGLPEGVTVLAAIQPQDLQLFAQSQQQQQQEQQHQLTNHTMNASTQSNGDGYCGNDNDDGDINNDIETITIKQEPIWNNQITTHTTQQQTTDFTEYFSRQGLSINLQQFLKFNPETIKRESFIENSPLHTNDLTNGTTLISNDNNSIDITITPDIMTSNIGTITSTTSALKSETAAITTTIVQDVNMVQQQEPTLEIDANGKIKKKRKYKKKPPKPKAPKPGQVHIATAIDGTTLFCCPECQMAYPEKTNLEQHLTTHKIERRYICDICGAGLKRKEHLERHKLGHSPERPYICSVCMKGFKRKEHLNLHFVIHSGDKNEICGECGKGFYRKDHLRKHAKSHASKRLKEEAAAAAAAASAANAATANAMLSTPTTPVIDINNQSSNSENTLCSSDVIIKNENQTICMPHGVTIHVPTSDNQTLPVQIQLPHIVTTSAPDGTTSTVILQASNLQNNEDLLQLHHQQEQLQQQEQQHHQQDQQHHQQDQHHHQQQQQTQQQQIQQQQQLLQQQLQQLQQHQQQQQAHQQQEHHQQIQQQQQEQQQQIQQLQQQHIQQQQQQQIHILQSQQSLTQ